MWSHNSTTCGLCSNRQCMCHTTMVPCLCTIPMTQYCYNDVLLSSTSLLNYQSAPDQNTILGFSHASNPVNPLFHVENDQEAGEQITAYETDSWQLPDPCSSKIDGSMNVASYCTWEGLVDQQDQASKVTQGIQNEYLTSASLNYPQASLQPTGAGITSESTFGTMNLPREWALNQFPFSSFHLGNLVQETVGIHSNSTGIALPGRQQQCSREDLQRPSQFPSMSRQEKILRYFEKKKFRKYKKKTIHSSRKMYARTRPRVRGRFARSSQIDA